VGEIIYFTFEFILKCIFWYPIYLPYQALVYFRRRHASRELPLPTRDQSRPATPTETAQAQTQLKIAWALLQEAIQYRDGWLGNVNKATRALSIARQMVAGATIPFDDGTTDVDRLSLRQSADQPALACRGTIPITAIASAA
jgi:hypothetical protein